MKVYINGTDIETIKNVDLDIFQETVDVLSSISGTTKVDRKFVIINSISKFLQLLGGNRFVRKDEQGLMRLGEFSKGENYEDYVG